jgi:branched-chain amino acid aminotransferase
MKKTVFLNGKFIPAQEARLPVVTPGFLYGWGLFETMRAFEGRIIYLAAHLKRLKDSSKLCRITLPHPPQELKDIIQETIRKNKLADARVRLTLWKSAGGADVLVTAERYQPFPAAQYRRGFRLHLSSFRKDEHSFLARLKTTNYLLPLLAYQEAKAKGFDEALILDSRGYISEASRSNIFLVKAGRLLTPGLDCGCLDGITRRAVFDLAARYRIKISVARLEVRDLLTSAEAFLTNSLLGIMPLRGLGKEKIGEERCAELTRFLQEKYRSLLK